MAAVAMVLAVPPAIYVVGNAEQIAEQQAQSAKFLIVPVGPAGTAPQLGQIAAETLGDQGRWAEIMQLNRGIPQPDGGHLEDPKNLHPGWVLKLPDDASGKNVLTNLPAALDPAAGAKAAAASAAAQRAAAAKAKAEKAKAAKAIRAANAAAAADRAEAARTAKAVLEARAARKRRAAAAAKGGALSLPNAVPRVAVATPAPRAPSARAATNPEAMDKDGLTPRTRFAMEEIKAVFGVRNIGGFCPGGCKSGHIKNSDHYTGHAIDIMLTPINDKNRALGDAIANYLVANNERLGVKYIVWNDEIWSKRRQSEGWRPYEHPSGNTTNDTLAHRDHVHLSVN